MKKTIILWGVSLFLAACGGDNKDPNVGNHNGTTSNPQPKPSVEVPQFNADNAYNHIKRQVDFGARVPGTPAHDSCAAWLKSQFESVGATVYLQTGEVERHDGKRLPLKNIVAAFNEDKPRRILLCAHWDSRYVADADEDAEGSKKPTLGADDGGSGVGVLLEIARIVNEKKLQNIGVDLILFDAEDQGLGNVYRLNSDKTWCLGAQFWSRTPHKPNYKAEYGVLLDMVGSAGAKFPQEAFSREHANAYLQRVWNEAHSLGYHDYFVGPVDRQITDDHVFVTMLAHIPTIDIINLPPGSQTGFGHYWHTQKDNMDVINKNTLKAVGQTLTQLLYKEDVGAL